MHTMQKNNTQTFFEIGYREHNGDFIRIQTPLQTTQQKNKLLKTLQNRKGQYKTVYHYNRLDTKGKIDYSSAIIDKIYLDFDHKTHPEKAHEEAKKTSYTLREKHGIHTTPYYTGGKGFALYINFQPINIPDSYKKPVLQHIWDSIQNLHSSPLTTLDPQPRGDLARLSRLPNTQHHTGRYCIPLDPWELELFEFYEVLEKAASPRPHYNLQETIDWRIERNTPPMHSWIQDTIKYLQEEEAREQEQKQQRQRGTFKPPKNSKDTLTEDQIQAARNTPISQIFNTSNKQIRCPFHNDRNPSLSIDHKRGLWHCFGCEKGGDTITAYMELHNTDFKTTVLTLLEATKK